MTKLQASRLRPGAAVLVMDDWFEEVAVVVHATDKGGVLTRTPGGGERWFSYTRVHFEG